MEAGRAAATLFQAGGRAANLPAVADIPSNLTSLRLARQPLFAPANEPYYGKWLVRNNRCQGPIGGAALT